MEKTFVECPELRTTSLRPSSRLYPQCTLRNRVAYLADKTVPDPSIPGQTHRSHCRLDSSLIGHSRSAKLVARMHASCLCPFRDLANGSCVHFPHFCRSFSWALLRANSCVLQLRVFCFCEPKASKRPANISLLHCYLLLSPFRISTAMWFPSHLSSRLEPQTYAVSKMRSNR
jgi:hypothetical protein